MNSELKFLTFVIGTVAIVFVSFMIVSSQQNKVISFSGDDLSVHMLSKITYIPETEDYDVETTLWLFSDGSPYKVIDNIIDFDIVDAETARLTLKSQQRLIFNSIGTNTIEY